MQILQFISSNNRVAVVPALRLPPPPQKKNLHPALQLHNDTVSRATNTRAAASLRSPFPHLVFLRTPVPSSSPSRPRPPRSPSFFTSLLSPLSSSRIPPFLRTPPLPSPSLTPLAPPPLPLAPLSPISVSVCSYPADLCPSCRCWFAHPAPLANMTKRDPQYSNRHTAFKCRMAGSTWVQL